MKSKHEMYPLLQQWFKYKNSMLKEDFCEKFHIDIHRLNYWIKKYIKEMHPVKSPSTGEFILLTIKESVTRETGSAPVIELDLPHGIRLRIY